MVTGGIQHVVSSRSVSAHTNHSKPNVKQFVTIRHHNSFVSLLSGFLQNDAHDLTHVAVCSSLSALPFFTFIRQKRCTTLLHRTVSGVNRLLGLPHNKLLALLHTVNKNAVQLRSESLHHAVLRQQAACVNTQILVDYIRSFFCGANSVFSDLGDNWIIHHGLVVRTVERRWRILGYDERKEELLLCSQHARNTNHVEGEEIPRVVSLAALRHGNSIATAGEEQHSILDRPRSFKRSWNAGHATEYRRKTTTTRLHVGLVISLWKE